MAKFSEPQPKQTNKIKFQTVILNYQKRRLSKKKNEKNYENV